MDFTSRSSSGNTNITINEDDNLTNNKNDNNANHTVSNFQTDQYVQENPYCKLSNFEIIKKIGKGQFSVVYKAICKVDNQTVALKKVQVGIFIKQI